MWAKIQKYRWTFNTWSEHDARWSQWKCKMPCRVAWNMNHDKYSCMDRYVSFFFGLFFFLLKFTSCSVFIGTCCWRKRNGKKNVIFITRVGLSFGILRNFLMNAHAHVLLNITIIFAWVFGLKKCSSTSICKIQFPVQFSLKFNHFPLNLIHFASVFHNCMMVILET